MNAVHPPALAEELDIVVRNAGIAFVGVILWNALRYVTQFMVARTLGPAPYGRYALGFAVVAFAAMIAELGLPQGLVRFVAVDRGLGDDRRVKGTILRAVGIGVLSGAALALVVILLAGPVAVGIFGDGEMRLVLMLLAVSLPLATPTTMLVSVFQGLRLLKYRTLVKETLDPLARNVIIAICLLLGGGLLSVVAAHLAASVVCLAAAGFLLARAFPPVFSPLVPPIYDMKRLLGFSWPLLFVGLMANAFFVTDSLLLGALRGVEEVGLYSAAQKTALFCSAFYASFILILGPIGADLHHRGCVRELQSLLQTVSQWSFTVTLPFSLVLAALAPQVMSMFGGGFRRASVALVILSAGWVPHALLGTTGTVLVMSGRPRLHLANFIGVTIVNVAANLVLIRRFGLLGAAAATAASMLLLDLVVVAEVVTLVGVHPFRRDVLKPVVAGAVAVAPLLLFAKAGTAAYPLPTVAVGGFVLFTLYFGGLMVLGLRPDERMLLRGIWARLRKRNES